MPVNWTPETIERARQIAEESHAHMERLTARHERRATFYYAVEHARDRDDQARFVGARERAIARAERRRRWVMEIRPAIVAGILAGLVIAGLALALLGG